MRTDIECLPCFMRQAVIAVNQAELDDDMRFQVVKEAALAIKSADVSRSPAHFTTLLHRRLRELIGKDPFEKIKRLYNSISLGLYKELKSIVTSSPQPLNTAARLAIAGNVIDFGIYTSVDIKGTIHRAINTPLAVDRFAGFQEAIDKTQKILYLTDNTGEIVFDRVLIELLLEMKKDVTVAVKGADVLNDAAMRDAEDTGLTGLCRVIDNGSDCIGTIMDMTSVSFRQEFEDASLIISKGQGNFETLHDHGDDSKDIFFLFQSKCDVLSKMLNITKGSMLLASSKKDYRTL